ncbi:hypothetical protein GCM10029992_07440 [Glycomyces albus]
MAEDIVQDERDALGRGHGIHYDQEGQVDRFVQCDLVGRVDAGGARRRVPRSLRSGQRLGEPFAYIGLTPGARRAEQVETDAAGDRRQPCAGDSMASCCCRDMAYQRA